mmetsp:Transcript_10899/g.30148  ORF Transcript_10899/g.30148 Transcript_10899/m.30148 type:complete len:3004 (+) Transcript_10899:116-9127(+)
MSQRGKKRTRRGNPSLLGTLEMEPTMTSQSVVDHSSNNPPATGSNLLRGLAESCNNHLLWHKRRGRDSTTYEQEGQVPKNCRDALALLRKILPRVEKKYRAAEPGHPGPAPFDVSQMCDFYCHVLSGGFCVHAPHLFHLGRGGSEVLPRVFYLMQHAVSKTVIVHSIEDHSVLRNISRTIARLLASLPGSRFVVAVVHDFAQMIEDLNFLLSYEWHDSDPLVEIGVFDETRSESVLDAKNEFLLGLNQRNTVHALQITLLDAFYHYLVIQREKKLGPRDECSDMSVGVYKPSDLYFVLSDQELLLGLLASLQQLLSFPISSGEGERINARAQWSSMSSLNILELIVSDWGTGRICNHVVMTAQAIVAKTIYSHFAMQYELSSRAEPILSRRLGLLLKKGFVGHELTKVQQPAVILLTECLQFVYCGNRFVDEKLSFGLFAFLARASGVYMASYTDKDILSSPRPCPLVDGVGIRGACQNLFRALRDPRFHHAALVLALSVIKTEAPTFMTMVRMFLESFEGGQASPSRIKLAENKLRGEHTLHQDAKRRKTCQESLHEKDSFRAGVSAILTEAFTAIRNMHQNNPTDRNQAIVISTALHIASLVLKMQTAIRISDRVCNAFSKLLLRWLRAERKGAHMMPNTIGNCLVVSAVLRSAESAAAATGGSDTASLNELIATCLGELASFQIKKFKDKAQIQFSAFSPMDVLPKLLGPNYQSIRLRVIANRNVHKTAEASTLGDSFNAHRLKSFLECDDSIARLFALECLAAMIEFPKTPRKLRQLVRSFLQPRSAENTDSSAQNDLIAALAQMSFCDSDKRVQYYASRRVGKIIMAGTPPILLTGLLEESQLNYVLAEDNIHYSVKSSQAGESSMTQFFCLVDQYLYKYCGAPLSQLSLDESQVLTKEGPTFAPKDILVNRWAALRTLISICNSCDFLTESGRSIFERAIIRVERLWSSTSEQPTIYESGLCFAELLRLFRKIDPDLTIRTRLLSHILPPIFHDIFVAVDQELVEQQYMILISFLKYFPHQNINRDARDAIFLGSSSGAVEHALDECLPIIFGRLVLEEDIVALRSLTGFKLFILHKKKLDERSDLEGISPMVHLQRGDRLIWTVKARGRPWSRGLDQQTNRLCLAPDIIERIVPVMFQRAVSQHLRFFADEVLLSRKDLSEIIRLREQLMLKGFVRELGRATNPQPSIRALHLASVVRKDAGGVLSNSDEPHAGENQASLWVSSSFMYILVNVVQFRWQQKKSYEKVEDLRSLCFLLDFLRATEAPQYLPQIMATLSTATAQRLDAKRRVERRTQAELRLFSVLSLSKLIKLVAGSSLSVLADNFASVIVSLVPSLREENGVKEDEALSKVVFEARSHAVSVVNFLAEGERGRKLLPFFASFTFLFERYPDVLRSARTLLEAHGLDFGTLQDTILTQNTSTSGSKASSQSDGGSVGGDSGSVKALSVLRSLRKNLHLTCSLISHEDSSVRREGLNHLLNLLRQNRKSLYTLIECESTAGASSFLTVCFQKQKVTRGIVTLLVEALLARSVRETEDELKCLVACCLGEVGAVGEHKLNDTIISAREDYTGEQFHLWRLEKAPWNTAPEEYQLHLVTKNLVQALRGATSSSDQHKVGYSIQQLLVLLQQVRQKRDGGNTVAAAKAKDSEKGPMDPWLVKALAKEGVQQDVEPFWTTEFHETEVASKKAPPFLAFAPTYLSWISQFCRYMIASANDGRSTDWSQLFHACRTSLRTPAGLGVAEFLLPLLVLDRMCHGNNTDEAVIVREMNDALTLDKDTEGQKIVNAVFSIVDTLNYWWESDTERRHKRRPSDRKQAAATADWRQDEATMRIEDLLLQIPLELQAAAAQRVGMNVRSLRLLEIASRAKVSDFWFGAAPDQKLGTELGAVSSARPAGTCPVECLDLMKGVLASLDDYETLIALARTESEQTLAAKLTDSMNEKVAVSDWSGALEACERGLQLGRDDSGLTQTFQERGLRCLLELGQYQSVLNQVRGINSSSSSRKSYAPYAIEAAWRLSDWKTLSSTIDAVQDKNVFDHEGKYHIQLGKALLLLHRKEPPTPHIDAARTAVMEHLAIADSYSRSYEQIVKLRSLQEIQDFSDHHEVGADAVEDWRRRLEVAAPKSAIPLVTVRLAIARLAGDRVLEGRLLLDVGRRARKNGRFHIATNSLIRADNSFNLAKDVTTISDFSELRLERAKLHYRVGDSSLALRLLHLGEFESITAIESTDEAKAEAARRASSIFNMTDKSMNDDEALDLYIHAGMKSIKWMVDDGLKGGHEVLCGFRTMLRFSPHWEKAHFHYARYVETSMRSRVNLQKIRNASLSPTMTSDDEVMSTDRTSQKYALLAIQHYAESLTRGHKHLYVALPRLLSLYFKVTELKPPDAAIPNSQTFKTSAKQGRLDHLSLHQRQINGWILNNFKTIPAQAFYSQIAQLVSRITHPHALTKDIVKSILGRVLMKFPEQTLWRLAWLIGSKDKTRKQIGDEIFRSAQDCLKQVGNHNMHNLLVASKSLFEYFIEVAVHPGPKDGRKPEMGVMPWFGEVPLTSFVPPVQAALSLSASHFGQNRSSTVFMHQIPRMRTLCRQIRVMPSKAKPKRVKAFAVHADALVQHEEPTSANSLKPRKGDIGEFHFLVKQEAKGDLRKDARVQDFNNVVNRLMMSTSHTKQARRSRKNLKVRTFAVTCLSEDVGIIEWVPNTHSLRQLIGEAYNPQAPASSSKRRGRRMANPRDVTMKQFYENDCQEMYFKNGNLRGAAMMFERICLKENPPVLFWWFVQRFPNPHLWFEARTRFTESAAAWSAVGHVIGLGDRHSENILVTTSGELVHVDFDCIFNKGLLLPRPEVVPFRLTPNMIDAFGPVGPDGIYKGSLEAAMFTLRNNRDTLLSVLEPFLDDPVIDWKRTRNQQHKGKAAAAAMENDDHQIKQAKRSLNVIDERLRGIYNLRNPNKKKIRRTDINHSDQDDEELAQVTPLSVEGQAQKLIDEATSSENLVCMYVGWMPWV